MFDGKTVLKNNGNRDILCRIGWFLAKNEDMFSSTALSLQRVLEPVIFSTLECRVNIVFARKRTICYMSLHVLQITLVSVGYLKYLGDGDLKSFETVNNEQIYGNDVTITKLESIGHVQKTMSLSTMLCEL